MYFLPCCRKGGADSAARRTDSEVKPAAQDLRRTAQRLALSEVAGLLSHLAATVRMTWGRDVSEALTCKERNRHEPFWGRALWAAEGMVKGVVSRYCEAPQATQLT